MKYTDEQARQVADAVWAPKTRDEIVAEGYVPGWNGEPVEVGEVAMIWGHNGWRQAVVTKVTDKYVHGIFTTPTAVKEARERFDEWRARDVESWLDETFRYYGGEGVPESTKAYYRDLKARAMKGDWTTFVQPTAGKGDRTPVRTNLYVLPKGATK